MDSDSIGDVLAKFEKDSIDDIAYYELFKALLVNKRLSSSGKIFNLNNNSIYLILVNLL